MCDQIKQRRHRRTQRATPMPSPPGLDQQKSTDHFLWRRRHGKEDDTIAIREKAEPQDPTLREIDSIDTSEVRVEMPQRQRRHRSSDRKSDGIKSRFYQQLCYILGQLPYGILVMVLIVFLLWITGKLCFLLEEALHLCYGLTQLVLNLSYLTFKWLAKEMAVATTVWDTTIYCDMAQMLCGRYRLMCNERCIQK